MEKWSVSIPEEISSYLQMLVFESDGLRRLCVQATQSEDCGESLDELFNRYKESYSKYRIALIEVVKEYSNTDSLDGLNYSVDFLQNKLILWRN